MLKAYQLDAPPINLGWRVKIYNIKGMVKTIIEEII